MKRLISNFIKYPILPNALIGILFIAGIFAISKTKMSFFPERPSWFVTISMVYPGASPEEIEEGITFKIEEAVKGIPNLKEITSTSSENFVRVQAEADVGTDMEEFTNEIKNAVDQINSFPVGAEKPIVFKNRGASRALIVMLSGDLDLKSLKSEAQRIEDDFLAMEDISQVNISGYPALEISIEVPEETLLRYGLTFDQIAAAVRDNNTDISGGELKSSSEEILIRSRNKKFSAEEIGEIVVRSNTDGSRILLRDIAEVKEQFADVPSTFLGNGKPAVTFQIQKLLHEDLHNIDKQVQEYVENYNASNSDTQLDVTFNFYNTLRSRMDLLLRNMGIGLLLIVFTLGIFLNLRLSFWVAFGIVLSFLGLTIIGYLFYDLTINMISLFGMILVVGILVDDGIVIAENIYSHFEKGKSFKRAAIDGTFEVMPAIITSVTTTMIAFLPVLLFVKGSFEFLKDMAFVVIAALGFSLIEAFLILPAHLASKHVLVKKENANIIRRKLDQVIDYFRFRVYGKIVRWNMKHRYIVLSIPIALILITAGLFQGGLIKFTYFPSIPFDSFNADLAFVPGTPQQKTEDYLIDFEQKIWEVNDSLEKEFNTEGGFIKYTFLSVGNSFQGSEQGSHAGNINVILKDMEEAPISTFDISNRIRKKIGKVPEAENFAVAGFNRFGTPVSISLLSSNLEAIRSAKEELKTALKAFPELKDIKDNSAAGKREIQLKLTPRAYALGMTHNDILRQIRQGFFGQEIQRIQKGKDEVRIWVRYPKSDRVYMDQLEKVKIKTMRGEQYPLAMLADYDIKRSVVAINHLNAKREVRVEGDLVDPLESLPPILNRIKTDVMPDILKKYPDVNATYEGQARRSQESSAELSQGLIIAVFIIIFLILLHYKSWYQMVLIISIIPLGWMGAMWGHGLETFLSDLTGRMIKPVSMLSLWGMIALMGILINDGVVFLDKFNLKLKQGMKFENALYDAATSRFRPIVLTTITTVAGLYPLILERSFQAQFLIPMAISVAYGVMVGTFFILTLLPSLIMVFNDIRWYMKWVWSGEKPPSRESVERVIIDAKKEEIFLNEIKNEDGT